MASSWWRGVPRVTDPMAGAGTGWRERVEADLAMSRPEPAPEATTAPGGGRLYQVMVRPLNGGPWHLAHTSPMTLERARDEATAWGPGRARVVELREVER